MKLKYRSPRGWPNLSLVVLFGTAVLLSLLAALQYRWITQVSDAEQERLKENLAIATTRFAQDFAAEMRLLFQERRPARPIRSNFGDSDELLERLTERYDRWVSTSQHTPLVQDLFAVRIISPGQVELLHFDPADRILQPAEWPEEFLRFRQTCVSRSFASGQSGGIWDTAGLERTNLDDISAIAIPIVRPPLSRGLGRSGPAGPFSVPDLAGWEIVRFNQDYFANEFLASLVARHFPKQGDFDYDILITREHTDEIVFRSSPSLALSDFQQDSDDRVRLVVAPAGIAPPPRGMPPGTGFSRGGPFRMRPGPDVIEGTGGWLLYARHHAGSLQSFSDQFRRRNLAVSLGVLGILAAGVIFTYWSSERARAMGKLQLEFAAGLSHDLRTPLAAIRSAGYNLATGNVDSKEAVARYGRLLQEQGVRLSSMVEQALLFAQTQSKRARYETQPVDLPTLINRAIESCQAILPKHPCKITSRTHPDLPPALTNAPALSHCLHNLLVNALKYGHSPASITVTAEPDMTRLGREIAISIENEGPAIDASDVPHIFEPFFRGTNTNGVSGNGLGLYIVKSTIEALGGRVSVTNVQAGGMRFTLHVPAAT